MKEIDFTKPVMNRVVGLEKTRNRRWLGSFLLVIGGLIFIVGVFLWATFQDLLSQDVFDLLTLLSEDREIIREYWQDTLNTFLLELPLEKLLIILLVLILLGSLLIIYRKNLVAALRKARQIRGYQR